MKRKHWFILGGVVLAGGLVYWYVNKKATPVLIVAKPGQKIINSSQPTSAAPKVDNSNQFTQA